MADFNTITVTNAGRQLIAAAIAGSRTIQFDRMSIGDGAAPSVPANASALTSLIADLPIAKVRNPGDGTVTIRASFKASSIGDFYLREIGLFAKPLEQGADAILIGYANAGDKADYIPEAGGASLMEEVLQFSLHVGNASVIIEGIDPSASATMQDIADLKEEINIDAVRIEVGQLKKSIDQAIADIGTASEGFVKKEGDTMSGNLKAPQFEGALKGSATMWAGWQYFDGIDSLNQSQGTALSEATSTVEQIVNAMPAKSRLIHTMTGDAAKACVPFPTGTLEIQKMSVNQARVHFDGSIGLSWDGAAWSASGSALSFTGWMAGSADEVGTVKYYAGDVAPVGYLFLHGQTVNRTTYARLFAKIGTKYGAGDGSTTFKLPDTRGYFIRCLDAGRGVDSNRALGSNQSDGAPNITGGAGAGGNAIVFDVAVMYGAFYDGGQRSWRSYPWGEDGGTSMRNINFEASRSNNVYGSANEIRPKNIAFNTIIRY